MRHLPLSQVDGSDPKSIEQRFDELPITSEFMRSLLDDPDSATARSTLEISQPAFDVRIHGATGDGTTDDSFAIQEAIDAAEAIDGGTVFFPTGTYLVNRELTINRNVNLIGTHSPANLTTDDETGAVIIRGADVIMLNITGTNRTTDRRGRCNIEKIHFKDGANIGTSSWIFGKYCDNMKWIDCSFSGPTSQTTYGHVIDVEESWDWHFERCIWKEYGGQTPDKYAVNMFNGADNQTNAFHFVGCRFYNGFGKTIFSDASGAGGTRNTEFFIDRCKFEDGANNADTYIDGDYGHVFVRDCKFQNGGSRHINISAASLGWNIDGCLFVDIHSTPVEYINTAGAEVGIHNNQFINVGSSTTRCIHVDFSGGGDDGLSTNITGNDLSESVEGTTPMVATTGTLPHRMHIGHNIGDRVDDSATGTVALQPWGYSRLNSSAGAVTATLPNGGEIGSQKVITMSNSSNSSTVRVTNHETSDPEDFTFDSTEDMLVLMWEGSQWITIANSGVAT